MSLEDESSKIEALMLSNKDNLATYMEDFIETIDNLSIQYYRWSDVKQRKQLGSGYVGSVYLGKLKLTQGEFIDCVIKKVHITKKHLEYLEKEITIMNCLSNLKLKHQIQLYGVIFGQKYISILMEKTKAEKDVAKYISQDKYWTPLTKEEYEASTSITTLKHKTDHWDYVMPDSEKSNLCYQMALAIQELQKFDISHRDIKPDNMLFDTDKVILIDYNASSKYVPESKTKGGVGTLGYMPPELEDGNFGESTDIYSLGVTMVEVWFGDIWASEENDFDIQRRTVTDYLSLLEEDYKCLYTLIDSCISKDPEKRPTIDEVVFSLDRIRKELC